MCVYVWPYRPLQVLAALQQYDETAAPDNARKWLGSGAGAVETALSALDGTTFTVEESQSVWDSGGVSIMFDALTDFSDNVGIVSKGLNVLASLAVNTTVARAVGTYASKSIVR